MKMDEEWPDHFEEHSRPSRAETEEAGERKLDAMANMIARPQSLQDYLRDQLGWFEIEPALRAMCERIIYNLDSNGYLQGRLEDLLGLDATKEDHALAERALAVVQKLDPPGVAARNLQECLLLQLTPGMPLFEQLQTLITSHLEDLEHNRLPVISRRTGLFDRVDPAGLGPSCGSSIPSRGPTTTTCRFRPSRPTCSSNWATTASTRFAWKTAARQASSSARITASCSPPGR